MDNDLVQKPLLTAWVANRDFCSLGCHFRPFREIGFFCCTILEFRLPRRCFPRFDLALPSRSRRPKPRQYLRHRSRSTGRRVVYLQGYNTDTLGRLQEESGTKGQGNLRTLPMFSLRGQGGGLWRERPPGRGVSHRPLSASSVPRIVTLAHLPAHLTAASGAMQV